MHTTKGLSSLFGRAERNLSSGCVRVEDPFTFAGLLMRDDPSWTQGRMNEILESGKTTRIDLPEPMPVMLAKVRSRLVNAAKSMVIKTIAAMTSRSVKPARRV